MLGSRARREAKESKTSKKLSHCVGWSRKDQPKVNKGTGDHEEEAR